jgi:endonuclease/exonuclease/phosphatase family metal-dependent hydrolase
MKIIFLNSWNGKAKEALTKFIEEQAHDTDIFCFQEAYDAMKEISRDTLKEYEKLEKYKSLNEDDNFSQAVYIKKGLAAVTLSFGSVLENEPSIGLDLYINIRLADNREFFISNFHGISRPVGDDKLDDPARIKQSKLLVEFFKNKPGLKIIGGDFNLLPETDSIRTFTENGYRDLVKDYDITTTRNELALSKYPNNRQYFADYVFTSPDIIIKNFSVPKIEISDHLPLIVEIQ